MENKSEPCCLECQAEDCTYTVKGTFETDGKINLNILLPAGNYRFGPFIDMTTTVAGNKINALFVHMQLEHNDPGNAVFYTTGDPTISLQIKRDDIVAYPSSTGFDFNEYNALIIIYHSNLYDKDDVSILFKSVAETYRKVCERGAYNEPNMKSIAPTKSPKKRGMSIILKAK
ncbi:hypothetical protein [Flavobacterium cerinum]|uniref:Uncharacterized protein n=1 Tax=Flavobacterium cerinum TaxID=2502784 RepID=A0A3S3QU51_9FLAO|nr:hypothetical protein [Flavobacterium cerinum]RWW92197.1 hypothetical protein EPI11_16360 [Flavobacterium cerinum]